MQNLDKWIVECPGGISLDTIRHLKQVFEWIRAIPGHKDANSERYLQMSGWYDVIGYLETVAKCQTSGKFPTTTTGKENISILDRFKHDPILGKMLNKM